MTRPGFGVAVEMGFREADVRVESELGTERSGRDARVSGELNGVIDKPVMAGWARGVMWRWSIPASRRGNEAEEGTVGRRGNARFGDLEERAGLVERIAGSLGSTSRCRSRKTTRSSRD